MLHTRVVLSHQSFEFVTPEQAPQLKIYPCVVELQPGDGTRIEVVFRPSPMSDGGEVPLEGTCVGQAEDGPMEDKKEIGGDRDPNTRGRDEDPSASVVRTIVPWHMGTLEDGGTDAPDEPASGSGVAAANGLRESCRSDLGRGGGGGGVGRLDASLVEPRSTHGRWRVPCFLKPRGGDEGKESPSGLPPIGLQVGGEGWRQRIRRLPA